MKTFLSAVVSIVLVLSLSGCATMFGGGPQQNVYIKADQKAATFLVKDQLGNIVFEGKDPGMLTLPKKYTYTVEVSMDGYAKQTVTISQGINGWFWGNLCFAGGLVGLVGLGVDFLTGNMWDLQPTNVSIKLRTAMSKTADGYLVSFYTRDDDGNLRSTDLVLEKI